MLQSEKTYLLTFAPNEDSNQPAHPRSLIRVFVIRMKIRCTFGYPKCAQWKFWSACANAQADLNFRWAHMSEGTFSYLAAPKRMLLHLPTITVVIRNIRTPLLLIVLVLKFQQAEWGVYAAMVKMANSLRRPIKLLLKEQFDVGLHYLLRQVCPNI